MLKPFLYIIFSLTFNLSFYFNTFISLIVASQIKKEQTWGFMCGIWTIYLLLLGVCAVIVISNLWQRWNQIISPVSNKGLDQQAFQQLIYPAITICNLAPNIKLTHKVKYNLILRNV